MARIDSGVTSAAAGGGRVTYTQAQVRSGPLPEASEVEYYERVLPGAAERLFRLAEMEQRHRHRSDQREQRLESIHTLVGQVSALIVALAFGFWSYSLIRAGHDLAGAAVGVVDLAVLVATFLYKPRP